MKSITIEIERKPGETDEEFEKRKKQEAMKAVKNDAMNEIKKRIKNMKLKI